MRRGGDGDCQRAAGDYTGAAATGDKVTGHGHVPISKSARLRSVRGAEFVIPAAFYRRTNRNDTPNEDLPMPSDKSAALQRFDVPPPLLLSLLWAALMGLYIYNDYFSMYLPGAIEGMSAGRMGPLGPITDTILISVALMLAIPAGMIYLSAALPPVISKWSNVVFGLAYTVIELLTFFGSRPFYQMVVVFEIIVTLLIIWTAIKWPREAANQA